MLRLARRGAHLALPLRPVRLDVAFEPVVRVAHASVGKSDVPFRVAVRIDGAFRRVGDSRELDDDGSRVAVPPDVSRSGRYRRDRHGDWVDWVDLLVQPYSCRSGFPNHLDELSSPDLSR